VSYTCRVSRQMSSGRCMPWHLPSRRGVSGHLPSECSACLTDVECQGRCRPDEECQGICLLNVARVLQMQSVKADVVWMRSVRAFTFWTQCMSYRCRVSRQMSSGRCMPQHLPSRRGVSGHLPSEGSACLTEAECQGRYRPDEGCQGICFLNAARVLQTQSVKADVVRTRSVRAFTFWM